MNFSPTCGEKLHSDNVVGLFKLVLLRGMFLSAVLPLWLRYVFSDLLSLVALIICKDKRIAVYDNLSLILNNPTISDVWRVFSEYGRYWADLPDMYKSILTAPKTYSGDPFPPPDLNFLGLTFHLGNFEVFGTLIHLQFNRKLNVVAERLKPDRLSNYFKTKRSLYHINTITHDDMRAVIKTLKRGNGLGILCDRVISGKGVEATLFGKKTTMPLNLVEYALRENIPVYISYCIKEGKELKIFCKKLDDSVDFKKAVKIITSTLENAVREYPYQWHLLSPI